MSEDPGWIERFAAKGMHPILKTEKTPTNAPVQKCGTLLTLPDGISEKDFMARVVELASSLGWMTYHVFDSRRTVPGFPDLICLRRDRLVTLELKVGKKRPTAAQDAWMQAFADVGAESTWYTPSEWSEIVELLQ